MKPINIAIADDHSFLRQGLIVLFKEFTFINVLFDVNNGKELLENIERSVPDVVLLDLEMPVMSGAEALKKIKTYYPKIKVIILSAYYGDPYVHEFLALGAAAFLPKNCFVENIVDCICQVNLEKSSLAFSSERTRLETDQKQQLKMQLTRREMEILNFYCLGKNTEEIANLLSISKRTVEWHKENMLLKTGTKNTTGLVLFGLKHYS
jgi:DNA-binding NarL/FixJ family response regulator